MSSNTIKINAEALEGFLNEPREVQFDTFQSLSSEQLDALAIAHDGILIALMDCGYTKVTISSPWALRNLVDRLELRAQSRIPSRITCLNIKWAKLPLTQEHACWVKKQNVQDRCDQIVYDVRTILLKHGKFLQEINFDFPGAFECLEKAIMTFAIGDNQFSQLTTLTLANGEPLFSGNQLCDQIFTAVTLMGHSSLEVLAIDGGHTEDIPLTPTYSGPTNNGARAFVHPGSNVYRPGNYLHKLKHLALANLPGLNDAVLLHLVSAGRMSDHQRPNADCSLTLINCPDITLPGVADVIQNSGRNLLALNLILANVWRKPERKGNSKWWKFWAASEGLETFVSHFRSTKKAKAPPRKSIWKQHQAAIGRAGPVHLCELIRDNCPKLTQLELPKGKPCGSGACNGSYDELIPKELSKQGVDWGVLRCGSEFGANIRAAITSGWSTLDQ